MGRSPYIDHVVLTNKHSGKRTHKVQAFVIHHMAARWTGKRCAEYFRDTPNRQASANYCIGYDGDVALNVEEQNRAWTSSSNWADQRAITYELANLKTGHPWKISDATINKLIVMLAEQHKRYGLKKASYTGDTNGTLWRHDWFANTNCPGPYLGGKLPYIADEVNKILSGGDKPVQPSAPTAPKPSKPQVTGGSIVNYMESKGMDSSYSNRAKLAKQYGINNYRGTAAQNIELLNKLKSGSAVPSKPQPPKKSITQMADEIDAGKHGNGHENRRKSLGISQAEYDKVRAEVNRRAGVAAKPAQSVAQMATRILTEKGVPNGHEARRKWLGVDNATYQKVRAEVNRRSK